jgi:hypothetical protein
MRFTSPVMIMLTKVIHAVLIWLRFEAEGEVCTVGSISCRLVPLAEVGP